jgi:hypothetical protein
MHLYDPRTLMARLDELAALLPFEFTSRPMMGGYIAYADAPTFVSLSPGGSGSRCLLPNRVERSPDEGLGTFTRLQTVRQARAT